MDYKPGDIIVVPFPFVDSPHAKPRPALVLSSAQFNDDNHHTICAMITTASNTNWVSDTAIKKLSTTGLHVASVVRPKLFTLDNILIKKKIGSLSKSDKQKISQQYSQWISI